MARNNPVDVQVGARIRQRRALLGMRLADLGTAVGVTYQQIQKYERGADRVSSSRLFEFSKVLNVPLDYFFRPRASQPTDSRKRSGQRAASFQGANDDVMLKP